MRWMHGCILAWVRRVGRVHDCMGVARICCILTDSMVRKPGPSWTRTRPPPPALSTQPYQPGCLVKSLARR